MTIAFSLLLLAAAFGSFLALGVLQGTSNGWKTPLVHGLIGAGGLLVLVLASDAPHASRALGLAGFTPGAEILLGIALLLGVLVFSATWRRGKPPGFLVGAHALVAIGGIVMVLAIVSLG